MPMDKAENISPEKGQITPDIFWSNPEWLVFSVDKEEEWTQSKIESELKSTLERYNCLMREMSKII